MFHKFIFVFAFKYCIFRVDFIYFILFSFLQGRNADGNNIQNFCQPSKNQKMYTLPLSCCMCRILKIFFFSLDCQKQSKPQQSATANNVSASRGCNDVDSLVKSSKLSASAPEFVPFGMNPYEVRL